MPCISIYIWWMHKWVKTSAIKFDSNTAKLLVADYVWMRGSQLFLKEVTENIIRPLWLQFPSVEYRSRGVPLCGHVTDWLFYSCFFFFLSCVVLLPVIYNMQYYNIKVSQKLQQVHPHGGDGKVSTGQGERPEWVEATLTAMNWVTNTSRPEPQRPMWMPFIP